MSFANYDLEAQKPPKNGSHSTQTSELDSILSQTSSQVQTFGSLIAQFNSQRRLLGSKRDSVKLREDLDLLQAQISDLGSAISTLISNINKAIDPASKLEVSDRQVMQKERLATDFSNLRENFKTSSDAYSKTKRSVPVRTTTEETPLLQDQNQRPQQTQQQQSQQLSQDQIEQTELQYHILLTEERNREIDQVAASVREVNTIFKDLGALVNQQGEQLDTIEENVLQLHGNTQQASSELRKAHEYQKRKGKWSCILLVALSVVVLVIVLAVVS